jgi:hypothetical protein
MGWRVFPAFRPPRRTACWAILVCSLREPDPKVKSGVDEAFPAFRPLCHPGDEDLSPGTPVVADIMLGYSRVLPPGARGGWRRFGCFSV